MKPLMFACAIVLLGCPPLPVPPPPPPLSPSCANVCDHWADLGCKEADPTPKGASCATVCENTLSGGFIVWNMTCRASVETCDMIDKCED